MQTESLHLGGFLHGSSFRSTSVAETVRGRFDIGILASSWDRRSVCILDAAEVHADHWVHITFQRSDSGGLQERHQDVARDFIAAAGTSSTPCHIDSLDLANSWRSLWQALSEVHRSKGHPLRVLLDLSVCPRYLGLAICATLIGRGMVDEMSVFYSEGVYPVQGTGELLFTGGQWSPVAIPGLCNLVEVAASRLYVVSLGFEGDMTMRTIARADPDRVSLLMPDPGTQPGYTERTKEANRALVEEYLVPDRQIVRAAAGDAIGAWKALAVAGVERAGENVYYLCCGTKPHALGLALRCMSEGSGSVLYNRPEDHRVVDTAPAGVYWRYDLRDVTCVR